MRSVLLTTSAVIIVLGITTSPALGDRSPTGVSYMLHENWGGAWSDAEKSPYNSEDYNMCWAAAAANVLDWTGWGHVNDMTNTDQMFGYYQDHWTDQGGLMIFGWEWWFTGVNSSSGWAEWSQVDVAGGGFHPSEDYADIQHYSLNRATTMTTIDTYLRSGYGTTIGIYGPGGHAITVWGLTHDADNPSEYNGLYITDSDDYKYHPKAPDRLRYYEVEYSGDKWYLQSFYGSNDWYIGAVAALAPVPTPPSAPGDLDGDNDVDAEDIDLLAAAIRGEMLSRVARVHDLNADGQVNASDMDMLIGDILGTQYGDFNLNGKTDTGDLAIWATTFLPNELDNESGWSNGDANGDGLVDSGDCGIWTTTFLASILTDIGGGNSDTPQYDSTPEPGTIALLCTGGVLILSRRKSRKR